MGKMLLKVLGVKKGVLEIGKRHFPGDTVQHPPHQAVVTGGCVPQAERHVFELVVAKRGAECGVWLGFSLYGDSVESTVRVNCRVNAAPCQLGKRIVNISNMVEDAHSAFVQGPVVNTPPNLSTGLQERDHGGVPVAVGGLDNVLS